MNSLDSITRRLERLGDDTTTLDSVGELANSVGELVNSVGRGTAAR